MMVLRVQRHKRNLRLSVLSVLAVSHGFGGIQAYAQDGAGDVESPPSLEQDLGLETVAPDDSILMPTPEAFPAAPEPIVAEPPAELADELTSPGQEPAALPQEATDPVDPFAEVPPAEAVSAPAEVVPVEQSAAPVDTPAVESLDAVPQDGQPDGTSGDPAVIAEPESKTETETETETETVPDGALSGLEIADDPKADTSARAPIPGDDLPPPPPKTEQGFQEMLSRKGGVKSPTVDSIKRTMAETEGKPFSPAKIRSLFFTHWQHEALMDAKRSRGNVRPPTQSELNALGTPGETVKPENRDIALNGIVFVNDADWTIWINGMRVTPSAIPREVIDLRVFKEYIEVKWLDDYTNQIFPIRLRTHQRFNLDARIFLPG